jgi:hypothetical protein
MTLPTGQIAFSDINVELFRPATNPLSLNDPSVRFVSGQSGGSVDMNALRGKSYVTYSPGGGDYQVDGVMNAGWSASCNRNATWTWSVESVAGSRTLTVNPPSGGTSTSFTASLANGARKTNASVVLLVTGNFSGITVNYRITLNAAGDQAIGNA